MFNVRLRSRGFVVVCEREKHYWECRQSQKCVFATIVRVDFCYNEPSLQGPPAACFFINVAILLLILFLGLR